jgi:hypothetical protein
MLIDWLVPRYGALDIEYKISTAFALGVLLSTYNYEFKNQEYYAKIVKPLVDIEVPAQVMELMPSLIFMLPCFSTEETYDVVGQIVEEISIKFFDAMSDRLDLLNCALISLGWSRTDCRNEDLAHRMFL